MKRMLRFLLLPGSRVQAVERILPVLLDAFEVLQVSFPDLTACIPAVNPKNLLPH